MNDDFKRPLGTTKKIPVVETATSPPLAETPVSAPVVEKKKGSRAFSFISVLLLLALLGVGVMAYFWYDAQNNLDDTQNKVSTLEADIAALKSNQSTTDQATTDPGNTDITPQTEVATLARNTVEAYMSTAGVTRAVSREDVVYLDDNFARVKVVYLDDKKQPTGKGEVFILKKVFNDNKDNASWALVGINPTTQDEINTIKTRYGVPSKVFTDELPA